MKTMELHLTVNGKSLNWSIAPGELLLDVLRRQGYFGVKRGCEKGECGACAVLMDGKPVNSCLMFAAQAEGREILTIEGVAKDGVLDPLQESFLDHGAVQCGFCTGGMVLSAKALLERHPDPTEERGAGSPGRALVPLHRVPQAGGGRAGRGIQKEEQGPAREAGGGGGAMSGNRLVVGRNVRKVDGVKLVTGGAAFTDDVQHPGHALRQDSAQPARPRAHPPDRHQQGEGAARRACRPDL